MWILLVLVALGVFLWGIGWRWESSLKRPSFSGLKSIPMVSILIPAYKSEATIEDTFKSVSEIDYPKKEVLVVNDYPDRTPELAKKYGFRVIESKSRQGKCHALNEAVKYTKGEILFFIDSDTVLSKNCLKAMVPWFTKKGVAAVSPRCGVKNRRANLLTRMQAIEHYFVNTMFKIQMQFGSLVSFWGFGIAIKKDVFTKLGRWPNTLLEDADFAGKLLSSGYKIQYEPQALARTIEPETWGELKMQRKRWGKGSMYAFFHHRGSYKRNPQFLIYFMPYIFLFFAIFGFVLFQTWMFTLPLISMYLVYSFSLKGFAIFLALFFIPLFSGIVTTAAAGSIAHMAILTASENNKPRELILTAPFIFIFVPFIMAYYLKGMGSAIKDKKRKKDELDFKCWEK